jgi:hypothetical protein
MFEEVELMNCLIDELVDDWCLMTDDRGPMTDVELMN